MHAAVHDLANLFLVLLFEECLSSLYKPRVYILLAFLVVLDASLHFLLLL